MSNPVPVRQAATIVMMRPEPLGYSVFVQRRPPTMVFAAGMYVFPGGAREEQDADAYETAVRETLEETGVVLRREDLHPWARWITPAGEVRRYDTTFFVCALPGNQEPSPRGTEMDAVAWLAPSRAVDLFASGELPLMLPTLVTLQELAAYADLAAVIAASPGRSLEPIRP